MKASSTCRSPGSHPHIKANPLQLVKAVSFHSRKAIVGGDDEEGADAIRKMRTAQMASSDASPDVEPEADSQGKVRGEAMLSPALSRAATPPARQFL